MADDRTEALDGEQLAHLARYFEEEVMSATNYKSPQGEISHLTEWGRC
jgi:hypothetical protein